MESPCKIPRLLVEGDDGNVCVGSPGYYNSTLRQPRTLITAVFPAACGPMRGGQSEGELSNILYFQISFIYQAHLCEYNFSALPLSLAGIHPGIRCVPPRVIIYAL